MSSIETFLLKVRYIATSDTVLHEANLIEEEFNELKQENQKLKENIETYKFLCEHLLDACEYYLPILEDRLSCGAYMRQKINFYKKTIKMDFNK